MLRKQSMNSYKRETRYIFCSSEILLEYFALLKCIKQKLCAVHATFCPFVETLRRTNKTLFQRRVFDTNFSSKLINDLLLQMDIIWVQWTCERPRWTFREIIVEILITSLKLQLIWIWCSRARINHTSALITRSSSFLTFVYKLITGKQLFRNLIRRSKCFLKLRY